MKLPRWWLCLIALGLLYLLTGTHQFVRFALLAEPSRSPEPGLPKPKSHEPRLRSQAEIYQLVNPAVVTVYSGPEIGSGSIVNSAGWILTNKHVVEPSLAVTVKTSDGKLYSGQVLDIDLRHDLALVQLNPPASLPTVFFAANPALKAGEIVYAIGSPAGQTNTITQGTFYDITPAGSLRTSPSLLKKGNSGGPLLNTRGEMVGINKGVTPDDRGLATPLSAIQGFLGRHPLPRSSATASAASPTQPAILQPQQ